MINLIKLSLSQLIFHYLHLGFIKSKSMKLLSRFFLGFYCSLAIINLNYTLFFLKLGLNFITQVLLKNGKIFLFLENTQIKNFFYLFKFFKIYFCIKRWWPGYLIRFKNFIKPVISEFFFLRSLPDLIVVLPYEQGYSLGHLAKEAKKLVIPSINLVDSFYNPLFIDYFIVSNIKNSVARSFYLNFLQSIILKSLFLKKKFFFNRLISLVFIKSTNEIFI